jgi:5-methylcytosine-specific restriction endonuclease McrA
LFFRQGKRCAVCNAPVKWNEAEVHHVKEHSKGGKTLLANGALVHKHCHPKSVAATGGVRKESSANRFHQAARVNRIPSQRLCLTPSPGVMCACCA